MLQNLLKERFHLAVHEEQRVLPVYVLVTAKGGPKLSPPTASARTFCGGGPRKPGQVHRSCTNMTMDALTQLLPKMSPEDFVQPVNEYDRRHWRVGLSARFFTDVESWRL
jgi:uncharacterized protein (TIGR03435 family)